MNRRVVDALFAHDPQFQAIAKGLLGVDNTDDFLAVVRDKDFAKMMPTASDVHVPGGSGVDPARQGRRRKRLVRADGEGGVDKSSSRLVEVDKAMPNPKKLLEGSKKALQATGRWAKGTGQTNAATAVVAGAGGAAALKGYQTVDEMRVRRGYGDPGDLYKADVAADSADTLDAYAEFSKVDTDKRQVFGWASVTHVNGQPVVDRQGDYIELEEVEKSAYNYVVGSRVGGSQHRRDGERPFHAADLIESFVVTDDKIKAMNLPDTINKGWWVGFKVNDDETWEDVKAGRKTGFSVHGRGKREVVEGDLMPAEVREAP